MSIHPSLSSSTQNKRQKSVLKRAERLKIMLEKGLWREGDSVFGLPKIKTIRIKIKKEKAAEKTEVGITEGATTETKELPPTKSTPTKDESKK